MLGCCQSTGFLQGAGTKSSQAATSVAGFCLMPSKVYNFMFSRSSYLVLMRESNVGTAPDFGAAWETVVALPRFCRSQTLCSCWVSVASIHIHFGGLSVVTGGGFLVAMESTCWNQDMVLCPGTVTAFGVYMVHCIYIFLSRVHIRTRSSNWRYELL